MVGCSDGRDNLYRAIGGDALIPELIGTERPWSSAHKKGLLKAALLSKHNFRSYS